MVNYVGKKYGTVVSSMGGTVVFKLSHDTSVVGHLWWGIVDVVVSSLLFPWLDDEINADFDPPFPCLSPHAIHWQRDYLAAGSNADIIGRERTCCHFWRVSP
jgi:hypothetical protein